MYYYIRLFISHYIAIASEFYLEIGILVSLAANHITVIELHDFLESVLSKQISIMSKTCIFNACTMPAKFLRM